MDVLSDFKFETHWEQMDLCTKGTNVNPNYLIHKMTSNIE